MKLRRKESEIKEKAGPIGRIVRERRKSMGFSQEQLAERAGVGLRFLRELEQGKETVHVNKVNLVLFLFGLQLAPVEMPREISK